MRRRSLVDLNPELPAQFRALVGQQEEQRRLDGEFRTDLLERQLHAERLREAIRAFGKPRAQSVDSADVVAAAHLEVKPFGGDQRDFPALRPGAFDVEAAQHDRGSGRVRAFEVPRQFGAAAGRRLEVNLDKAGRIAIGDRVFPGIGDVLLLAGDRRESGRHSHADRADRPLLGIDRLRNVQPHAIALHAQRPLARDVENRPHLRLAQWDLPGQIELPFDAVGLDSRSLRDGGRDHMRPFNGLNLAMLP